MGIHQTTADGQGIASLLTTLGASSSTVKATVTLVKDQGGSDFMSFSVTLLSSSVGVVDFFTVTPRSSTGVFTTGEQLRVLFSLAGDKGTLGATGSGGATGPTGTAGGAGTAGATGPTGNTGPQGTAGGAGGVGATGPTGANGTNGGVGATGPTGNTGPQGTAGGVGGVGPTGPTGNTGSQGTAGGAGTAGATGPTGPGSSASVLYCALLSDFTLNNASGAQKAFNASTNGAVAVAASTLYEFEGQFVITDTGTTSHQWGFLLGGTATLTSGFLHIIGHCLTTVPGAPTENWSSTPGSVLLMNGAIAAAGTTIMHVKGRIRVNGAGTIIPQVSASAAPGAAPTMKANSSFQLTAIGSSATTTVGTWT